jgi:hypothetical protein
MGDGGILRGNGLGRIRRMTRQEFWTLTKCGLCLIAAVFTGNKVALDNTVADIEATHAQIDTRKGIVR